MNEIDMGFRDFSDARKNYVYHKSKGLPNNIRDLILI